MKLKVKGDYFYNEFHFKSSKSPETADEFIEKYCPADLSDKLWEATVDYSHIEKIIESAKTGHKNWKILSFDERGNYLKKYQENIILRKDELAQAISLETGKPLWEASTEVTAVINKVQTTLDDSLPRIKETYFDNILPQTKGLVFNKPLGICLIIGPFNFPCHLANGQILSALIAGNSIIFKPSEKTIYSGQILIECFHQADFPKGVINFINGGPETAKRLLTEQCVKGVFFTGSKEAGKKILDLTYKDLSKLVALELGGKNTSIIHEDANIDLALLEMLTSCFLTSGQRCTSTSIIAIHEKIQDNFIARFHQLAKKIIIDHPLSYEQEPFMGPLIDDKATQNFLVFMGMAKREGAEEIMRGKTLANKRFKGHYVSPSIHLMSKPVQKSLFFESEIFGPTCTFVPYRDIQEALEIANMGEYGLAASIFTESQSIYKYCLDELEVGLLNLNRGTVGASAKLPFGGIKNSGNYRPASVSMIDACVYPVAGLISNSERHVDFNTIKGLQT